MYLTALFFQPIREEWDRMQAVILAAGMGKRLKQLTKNNTKCMVEEWTAMMSFEQVIDIFADYLALDTELEVCKSQYGYIRVEFHGIEELPGYCSGMVCRTPPKGAF